ncbi:MAG: 2-C-methyl-D-erythritol 4-phosphate cytidylyltransferase [Lachnospiraceae bacterium]|nr:2-C-methyl-D-erythritol 4-phosphate cytidylyltransferase [Lachnospiraceae bacterium]
MGEKVAAIVLAAGRGSRMNSDIHKQYMDLGGKPVLFYSLETFERSFVNEVVLVTGEEEIDYCKKEIVEKYGFSKVRKIIAGGRERYHSVWNGLCALDPCDIVMIHDGARPFVDEAILERCLADVREHKACVVGMPVKDTIKLADDAGFSRETLPRHLLWTIQTPQVFAYDLVLRAFQTFMDREKELLAEGIQITDDAMVVEHFTNTSVKLTEGSYENIKITTPEDLPHAQIILKSRI